MSEVTPKPHRRRLCIEAAIGVLLLAAFVSAGWYLTSARFNEWVRGRIVAQLQEATGGRVDLPRATWNLSRLRIEAQDLTIHGLEGPDQLPYVHIDRILIRAKILSFFGRELALRYLELDHPVVHVIVYPDGTTNQPVPNVKRGAASPVEPLFDLAINRAIVRDGELRINDRSIPFDFSASDVSANMGYVAAAKRYEAVLHAGKMDTVFADMRPFSAVADAEITLSSNAAQLKSLTLVSAKSRLEASGSLENFAQPIVNINYRATLDVAQAGSILRVPQARGGLLQLEGRGTYVQSNLASSGKLNVRGFDWRDASFSVRNAAMGADYVIDKTRIKLPHLFANLLGGTVTGDIEVTNWAAAPPVNPRARSDRMPAAVSQAAGAEQKGEIRLRVANLSLPAIAGAASTSVPLDRMNLAGTADGTISTKWKGSLASAVTELDLTATPPPSAAAEQLPLTGRLRGAYRAAGHTLDIEDLALTTRASRLSASGTLGTSAANLRLIASTTDVGEWKPLLDMRGRSTQLPVDIHGQASFNGTVSGKFSGPAVDGRIQVTNFDSLIAQPAPTAQLVPASAVKSRRAPVQVSATASNTLTLPPRMHWDALTADLQYSPALLALHNAVLRHGTAEVKFDASAVLHQGQFADMSAFTLHATVRNAQLSDLQALAGYEYPVSGLINCGFEVSGTASEPRGKGRVELTKVRIHEQPVARITSEIDFADHQAQFNRILVVQNQAQITGSAAYNLTTRAFRFDLHGSEFSLANLHALNNDRMKATGTVKFTAQGSGTAEEPSINADVVLSNVVVNGERVGDLVAQAHTTGDTMKVVAHSNVGNSDLRVDGNVRLRENYPTTLAARFTHLDLDPVLGAYLRGRLSGHSYFAGDVTVKGPLKFWRNLDVTADISEFLIPVQNLEVRNQGPIRFAISKQVLDLRQVHLVAEDTDLVASGTAQMTGAGDLNLAANGRVNLKLVQSLSPDYASYGQVFMDVQVGGNLAKPLIGGKIRVANAGISYIDLPNGLSDINGTLVFNSDRLQIQKLTARTGGGTLDMTGYVTYGRTIGFNIQAVANDIRLRYPPGVSAAADANLRLTGTLQSSLLAGDLTITRFGLNPRFDFASYLARSKQVGEVPDISSPVNNAKLDIHVTSTPELQVQTSLAKLSGNVDLRLRGTPLRPALLGRVDIVEGDIVFNGTKYRLERGDVTFTTPTRIEPVLDIQASTRVRDYDITLGFHGPTDKLSTTYRSDPPLATADIIALLAFGRTREESALQPVSNQNFTETASNAILSQALNATVSSRVQKLFGVSRIKIDPQVGGAENNPSGARVTIEQQVANDLTITYITDLARSNQQIISVEYNFSRAVSLVAIRDQYGVVSFDVRIRQRKR